jgi:predicted small lipoprotein YifL
MGRSECYARCESSYGGGYTAIRVLLVLAILLTLYGCGQVGAENGHPDKKDAAAPAMNKQAMVEEKAYNSAEVDLQPANGSGTRGTATFSKAKAGGVGVKVSLKVTGLSRSGTMYLAHIHPGTCAEEEGGGAGEHGHSHHEHGASEEIEYPLTPVEPNAQGDGTSTTVVHNVTLEGLLSGEPKHVNVHEPGPGEPPPVTCANLDEAL